MFEHTNTNPLECDGNMLTSKVHSEVQPFLHMGVINPKNLEQEFGNLCCKPYVFRLIFVCLKMCSFCNTKIQVANDIQEIHSAKDL
jgi:hypothetical protein